MGNFNSSYTRNHLKKLINEFGIFNRIFSTHTFQKFISESNVQYRKRSLTPDIMLWGFLNQVLDEDHSCRWAVSTIIAKLKVTGQKVISVSTGAYCQARKKLPENFFFGPARLIGKKLDEQVNGYFWKDFNVKIIDGSDLKLPVTAENLKEYSRPANSYGLLRCRVLGIFSLSHGGLIDMEIGKYEGKGSGELSLLRNLYHNFNINDLILGDRLFCTFFEMGSLKNKNCNFIFGKNCAMKTDKKRIKRLGRDDYLIKLHRPLDSINSPVYKKINHLPKSIVVREVKIRVQRKGFRPKSLSLITSLKDPEKYRKEEIENLYSKRRWLN